MSNLETKLQKLREDWVKYPEKRVFIERQAQAIKRAIEYYSKKNKTEPAEKKDETFEAALKIFGIENATP